MSADENIHLDVEGEAAEAQEVEGGALCPHGLPDGVGCIVCDTDGAAESTMTPEELAQARQAAVTSALSSRARDLSLSITNPPTLARKLRESLIDLVGPEHSRAYHIGAAYSSETGEVQVQIAAVSPTLLARFQASTTHGAELEVAYQRTVNGWEVAVGAKVSAAPMGEGRSLLRAPDDYSLGASFSVTVRK